MGGFSFDGTRITVHRIATLYKQGQSPEEIAGNVPHLTLGQVYAALAHHHANARRSNRSWQEIDTLYDEPVAGSSPFLTKGAPSAKKIRRVAAFLSRRTAEEMNDRMEYL